MTDSDLAAAEEDGTDPVVDELRTMKDRAHEARIQYEHQRGLYHDFAYDIARLVEACLVEREINFHTITAREKDPESFERKAAQASAEDPTVAKHKDPLHEITDKAAVRITTYFLETVRTQSRK